MPPSAPNTTLETIASIWPMGAVLAIILCLAMTGYWKIYRPEMERRRQERLEDMKSRESTAVSMAATADALSAAAAANRDTAKSLENLGHWLHDEIERARARSH
jgi:cytochrome oxidase assembly protein ShyY1